MEVDEIECWVGIVFGLICLAWVFYNLKTGCVKAMFGGVCRAEDPMAFYFVVSLQILIGVSFIFRALYQKDDK